jgi:putative tryptophan/tyrosine transport system substrate-binding protein
MKRREFIALVGGAAVAWPVVTLAQQAAMPVVGFLCSGSPTSDEPRILAVQRGLTENGYVVDRNLTIEYRWAHDQYDRLPGLAADLIRRRVAAIVAIGTTPAALAAKAATSTIPIVFVVGADPIALGLVDSLNKPGGNITGVSFLNRVVVPKQVELLHEMVPQAGVIGFLVNPSNPYTNLDTRDAQEAATALRLKLAVVKASTNSDLEVALDALTQEKAGGVIIAGTLLFFDWRRKLVGLAAERALPAIYPWREATVSDGLMSYGSDLNDAFRKVGVYTSKILNGAKPGDLPVEQSTKLEFAVNLKTAKALGLTVPPTLLARADEVIE